MVFVSATPGEYERTRSTRVVEQIVRPTGIVDPSVEVRATRNQIDDLMNEIRARVERNERVLVTTLTKKMSEDLSEYLLEMGFKVRYLHSEIDTLERIQIIRDLRLGEYDVLVGVNLLREGLDLPEVSLVAILDADKEGFLRGETSLIQTIGRAARNVEGTVLMYADKETKAMRAAIAETDRRRAIQLAYNEEHGITAATIVKGDLRHRRVPQSESKVPKRGRSRRGAERKRAGKEMPRARARADGRRARGGDAAAAEDLRFEYAAQLRDELRELRRDLREMQASEAAGRGDRRGDLQRMLGWRPWSSTARASRSATFRSAGEAMTPPPSTRTCATLAAEVEELRTRSKAARRRRSRSSAGTQVQGILEAAETTAAEIEQRAADDARATREQAAADAERTRADAIARAQAHVAAVSRATAVLSSASGRWTRSPLRSSTACATGANAAGRPTSPRSRRTWASSTTPPRGARERALGSHLLRAPPRQGRARACRARRCRGDRLGGEVPVRQGHSEFVPVPAPEAASESEASGEDGDLDGARLIALNMALNGDSRAATDRFLAEHTSWRTGRSCWMRCLPRLRGRARPASRRRTSVRANTMAYRCGQAIRSSSRERASTT